MSEAEAEGEPAEDDQPAIDDDEMADFSAVAEEIEAGVDDEEEDLEDVDGESADLPSPDDDLDAGDVGDRVSIGDVYCNALGMSAAVSRARFGSADPDDRSELVDEYAAVARDLQIDEYVDDWMAMHGGMDELSPGQAIMISTMLFGGLVVMDDPELIDGVAAEVSD